MLSYEHLVEHYGLSDAEPLADAPAAVDGDDDSAADERAALQREAQALETEARRRADEARRRDTRRAVIRARVAVLDETVAAAAACGGGGGAESGEFKEGGVARDKLDNFDAIEVVVPPSLPNYWQSCIQCHDDGGGPSTGDGR